MGLCVRWQRRQFSTSSRLFTPSLVAHQHVGLSYSHLSPLWSRISSCLMLLPSRLCFRLYFLVWHLLKDEITFRFQSYSLPSCAAWFSVLFLTCSSAPLFRSQKVLTSFKSHSCSVWTLTCTLDPLEGSLSWPWLGSGATSVPHWDYYLQENSSVLWRQTVLWRHNPDLRDILLSNPGTLFPVFIEVYFPFCLFNNLLSSTSHHV